MYCSARERHPAVLSALTDATVHPDMKTRHARLSDDARDVEISLHRGRKMGEVRLGHEARRRRVRRIPRHVGLVFRAQARRPLAQASQDEAERDDAIHTGASLRVGPRRNDREHRDGDGASPDQPPAAWPHEQRRRGHGEEQRRREPEYSLSLRDGLRQLRQIRPAECLGSTEEVNRGVQHEEDGKGGRHA